MKLLECLIENLEYFRFELNVLELLIENIAHVHFRFEFDVLELFIENIVHFRLEILTSGLATQACLSILWNVHLKILCIFGVERCSGTYRYGRVVLEPAEQSKNQVWFLGRIYGYR